MFQRVKELREKRGLTQKQFGEQVGVSRQAINAIEFQRLVHSKGTLQIPFMNAFTSFIMGDNMKYVGYAIIVIAAFILVITLLRRKKYDEYQQSIQAKCSWYSDHRYGTAAPVIYPD